MNTLKPCPFCGGEATENRDISNSIYCKKCFAEIDTDCVDWNIRPIEDALQARIAELEALVNVSEGLYERIYEQAARIAELEAKQRWRVVADGELPNKNDYYWARDDLGQQGRMLFYDGEWNKFTNLSYITHWMPLPEPPIVYGKEREK